MHFIVEHKKLWNSDNQNFDTFRKPVVPVYLALSAFSQQRCSEPHDMFFGLLDLIEAQFRADLVPDYDMDLTQVYLKATEVCVRSIELHLKSPWLRISTFLLTLANSHKTFGSNP
jgi:hypothetical protein